jgi:hypothetical protein
MNWQTVYDVGSVGESDFIWFIYIALAPLALALLLQIRAWLQKRGSFFAKILAVFAMLIAGLGYGMNIWDHNRLAAKLADGDVLKVAGPVIGHQIWKEDVTNIKRDIGRSYNHWETINVGGVAFIWAPGALEAAFTNAKPTVVDLRDGLVVRIHYIEDVPGQAHQRRIVRLEVADDMPPPEAPLPNAPFPSSVSPYSTIPNIQQENLTDTRKTP